jgi:hypothetical protein
LLRHPKAKLENHEWGVTVFNSSVENHVEKRRPQIETARDHATYTSLHKFSAD